MYCRDVASQRYVEIQQMDFPAIKYIRLVDVSDAKTTRRRLAYISNFDFISFALCCLF